MLSRSAIKSKAIALLRNLRVSKGTQQKILLKEVSDLVQSYPASIEIFSKNVLDFITITKEEDENVRAKARQALALIGHAELPKSPGVRILSIDGGGTRGLVSIEILRHIERHTKKRIHELFDLICGVSSGAIITMAVGSGRFSLDELESFYRDMSMEIFKADFWTSTPRLLWSHAYYDASVFEKTLKKAFANMSLMSLASDADCPKLAAVSVNARTMQPYLFRNYSVNPQIGDLFDGTAKAEVWQAIRASSAAPGFFEEAKFNSMILLDGGMLVNNCTGLAHAEANLLWPKEPVQCLVSIGSGRFRPSKINISANATTLYEKAYGLLYSATDTETVHQVMHKLIKPYYRFNPPLSENLLISENRKMKLDQLKQDANTYMKNNQFMIESVAQRLLEPRQLHRRLLDNLSIYADPRNYFRL